MLCNVAQLQSIYHVLIMATFPDLKLQKLCELLAVA